MHWRDVWNLFKGELQPPKETHHGSGRCRERAVGNPQHIKTWVRYASMRQIHAAIKHLDRGDFECAITLAAAGEEMLPPKDKPHFASCKA
jgi:hypothetical protein